MTETKTYRVFAELYVPADNRQEAIRKAEKSISQYRRDRELVKNPLTCVKDAEVIEGE